MDAEKYEKFCGGNKYGSFTQSLRWSSVKSNWKSETIVVKNDRHEIIGVMLVLIKRIPFLNTAFMYAPRGPVCDMHDKDILEQMFDKIKLLQRKYNAYILKIDPLIDENDTEAIENLCSLGFEYHGEKVGYENTQCRENYVIDIDGRHSEEIMAQFKAKWRYNIRLAQKKGVVCGFYGKEKIDDFYTLMLETAKRDGFSARSKEYFVRLLTSFKGNAKLCMCYLGDIPLSGALMIDYAGTTSYVYGCSANEYRNYMPNYLMQWTMIKHAADVGNHTYDFCGIPYWYDENHRNYGVYKFKQGFNGRVQVWAGEFDYVFKKNIEYISELAMRIKKLVS